MFRDGQFAQLRRQFNALQSRFSLLAVQAELTRGTLKASAMDALKQVDSMNRLIALMAKRCKLMKKELNTATTQLDDAKVEMKQLYQQRRDLEARLAFATGGSMSASVSVSLRLCLLVFRELFSLL